MAKSFNEKLSIDGVIITKLDSDTRGGAALSVRAVTGKPIKFSGTGEKLGDIEILSELQAVPENTQEIVVNVYFNNQAGIETISLVTLNSKEYAAFINGTAEFAVDKKTVDALIEELRALAKNPLRTN